MATANEDTTFVRVEYYPAPSLQHLATVRIAITLWEEKVITNAIQEFMNFSPQKWTYGGIWMEVEKMVTHRIPLLGLPKGLANAVACIIRPIGLQIMRWLDSEILPYHQLAIKKDMFLKKICWTPWGTIDKTRTAKLLIDDTNLHVSSRFEMACLYCPDEVAVLWSEMPTELKREIRDYNSYPYKHDLVSFWAKVMDGDRLPCPIIDLRINYDDIWSHCLNDVTFQWMSSTDYIETVKYLWELLTEPQRSSALDWVSNNFDSLKTEAAVFCLSKMTDYQQRQVLMTFASLILRHLASNWVLRDFFLPTLEQVWSVIDGKDFLQLLTLFCKELDAPINMDRLLDTCIPRYYYDIEPHGIENWRHQIVFRQIWCRSPLNFRKHVFADGCQLRLIYADGWALLQQLLKWEDRDNLALVLSSGSDEDRKELLNSTAGKYFLMELFSSGRLGLLNELLMMVLSSVDKVTEFMRILRHKKLEEDAYYFLCGATFGHKRFHTDIEILDYLRRDR